MEHVDISGPEAADRLAIRELVEAYAYCADRRDANGQMALFTVDAHFVVYMDASDPKPSQELHSRDALAPVFADLNQYAATMNFLGQSTILTLSQSCATGVAYCLAHHLTVDGAARRLMIAALHYADTSHAPKALGYFPSVVSMSTGSSGDHFSTSVAKLGRRADAGSA